MISCDYKGRLGNLLFQDISKSILAEKFNLKVDSYQNYFPINMNLYNSGVISNNNLEKVTDDNFLHFLNLEKIENGLHLDGFFQIKNFLLENEEKIRAQFRLDYEEVDKNDVFIHVRMGDIANLFKWQNVDYFKKALSKINYRKIYISSDDLNNVSAPHHKVVQDLISEFNMIFYLRPPAETINFAKNFNNLILSQGTFSWWIGFLSRAENIYYPKIEDAWHGDIFVFDNWNAIEV
jgi:hypothetical protein